MLLVRCVLVVVLAALVLPADAAPTKKHHAQHRALHAASPVQLQVAQALTHWSGTIALRPKAYHQGAALYIPSAHNVRGMSFWTKIDSRQGYLHDNKYLFDLRPDTRMYLSTTSKADTMHGATMYVNQVEQPAVLASIPVDQWVHVYLRFDEPLDFASVHVFERYNHQEFLTGQLGNIALWRDVEGVEPKVQDTVNVDVAQPHPAVLAMFNPKAHTHTPASETEPAYEHIPSLVDGVSARLVNFDCSDCAQFINDPPTTTQFISARFFPPNTIRSWDHAKELQLTSVFASFAKVVPDLVSVRVEHFDRINSTCVTVRIAVDDSVSAAVTRTLRRALVAGGLIRAMQEVGMDDPFVDWLDGPEVTTVSSPLLAGAVSTQQPSEHLTMPTGKTHPPMRSGVHDAFGCDRGNGFTWCATLKQCVQDWEHGIDGPCPVCIGSSVWCDVWQRCISPDAACPSTTLAGHAPPLRFGQEDPTNCLSSAQGGPGFTYCAVTKSCVQDWEGGRGGPCLQAANVPGEDSPNVMEMRLEVHWENPEAFDSICFRGAIAQLLGVEPQEKINVRVAAMEDFGLVDVIFVAQTPALAARKRADLTMAVFTSELLLRTEKCGATRLKVDTGAASLDQSQRYAVYTMVSMDIEPRGYALEGKLVLNGIPFDEELEELFGAQLRAELAQICGVAPQFVRSSFLQSTGQEATVAAFVVQPATAEPATAVVALGSAIGQAVGSGELKQSLIAAGFSSQLESVAMPENPQLVKTQMSRELPEDARRDLISQIARIAHVPESKVTIMFWAVTPHANTSCVECQDKLDLQFRFEVEDEETAKAIKDAFKTASVAAQARLSLIQSRSSLHVSDFEVTSISDASPEATFASGGEEFHTTNAANFTIRIEGLNADEITEDSKALLSAAVTTELMAQTAIVSVVPTSTAHTVTLVFESLIPGADFSDRVSALSSDFFSGLLKATVVASLEKEPQFYAKVVGEASNEQSNTNTNTQDSSAVVAQPSPSPQFEPMDAKPFSVVDMVDVAFALDQLDVFDFGVSTKQIIAESVASLVELHASDAFVHSYDFGPNGNGVIIHVRLLVPKDIAGHSFVQRVAQISTSSLDDLLHLHQGMGGWSGHATLNSSPTLVSAKWLDEASPPQPTPSNSPPPSSPSLSPTPTLSPPPSPSNSPTHAPTPSPSQSPDALLGGGTVLMEVELDVDGPTLLSMGPQLKTVFTKIVQSAAETFATNRYLIEDIDSIRSLISPTVMIIGATGRTGFGDVVDMFSATTASGAGFRKESQLTIAVPVISDSFVDANSVAEALKTAVVSKALDSELQATFNKAVSASITQLPRWDVFSDTAFVARLKFGFEVTSTDQQLLVPGSELEKLFLKAIAKTAGVPLSWIALEEEILPGPASIQVFVTVQIPVDKIGTIVEDTKAAVFKDVAQEFGEALGRTNFVIRVAPKSMTVDYVLVPAHADIGPRSVFVSGTAASPYEAVIQIPEAYSSGFVRGVSMPVIAGASPRFYDLHIDVTEPVEIEIAPLRDPTPLKDLFA